MIRLMIVFKIHFIVVSIATLLHSVHGTSPPIVLPDKTIRGTQRDRFEIHDLTDMSGGKWKAVHIPDDKIQSILREANLKNGTSASLDIQHELESSSQEEEISAGESSEFQLPSQINGRVHMFTHDMKQNTERKNASSPAVGKLLVASENEHEGRIKGALHPIHPTKIKLRGYMKEEEPKNREIIHRETGVKPSLIVARIPEDDDDENMDDLPLRKTPVPIVASLRPLVRAGSMRSNILAETVHHPTARAELLSPKTASVDSNKSTQNTATNQNSESKTSSNKDDSAILEKIKGILLKSSAATPHVTRRKSNESAHSAPAQPEKSETSIASPNVDGLFLPSPASPPANAFSNHASVLKRIAQPKREALLLAIIKALLARGKTTSASLPFSRKNSAALLPHYSRQALLQGLQNLQMRETVGDIQQDHSWNAADQLDPTSSTMPRKSLDEVYEKQREEEVKQELARANEEALEAKKMRLEESESLANYERFSHPESRQNWANIAGIGSPIQSQTPDGQLLSTLGTQQLNMFADNPSTT